MKSITKHPKKTILVVGGAGYIGSHANKALRRHGYETVVFDNLSRGFRTNVKSGAFIEADLQNVADLEALFRHHTIDGIMHFAALTDIGESIKNPAVYYFNNVSNTLNLLHAAARHQVKFFVFSSSAAIFGVPQTDFIDENHPCSPINPYGRSKLMIEQILADFDSAHGLKSCCLRYFNAAGADPEGDLTFFDRKENNLIPLLLKSIKFPDKKVTIFGSDYPTPDGTCIRDYIHVSDLAEAHVKGLEHLFATGTTCAYNLGNAQGYSVKAVVEAARKVTGATLPVEVGPRRAGDPPILVAESSKARRELGWIPKYADLETMIMHAYKAFV